MLLLLQASIPLELALATSPRRHMLARSSGDVRDDLDGEILIESASEKLGFCQQAMGRPGKGFNISPKITIEAFLKGRSQAWDLGELQSFHVPCTRPQSCVFSVPDRPSPARALQ